MTELYSAKAEELEAAVLMSMEPAFVQQIGLLKEGAPRIVGRCQQPTTTEREEVGGGDVGCVEVCFIQAVIPRS